MVIKIKIVGDLVLVILHNGVANEISESELLTTHRPSFSNYRGFSR